MALQPGTDPTGLMNASHRKLVASAGGEGAGLNSAPTFGISAANNPFGGGTVAPGQILADQGGVANNITPNAENTTPAIKLPSSRDWTGKEFGGATDPTYYGDFRDNYAAADEGNKNTIDRAHRDWWMGSEQANRDYDLAVTNAQTTQQSARQRLEARLASQGLGGSTQGATALGDLDTQFSGYLQGLTNNWTDRRIGLDKGTSDTLAGVTTNRNQLHTAQGAEDAQLAVDRAKAVTDAQAKQDEADRQATIAAQDRADRLAAMQAPVPQMPQAAPNANIYQFNPNNAGADANNTNMLSQDQLINRIGTAGNMDETWMRAISNDNNLPQPIRDAINRRLQQMDVANTPATPGVNPDLMRGGRAF